MKLQEHERKLINEHGIRITESGTGRGYVLSYGTPKKYAFGIISRHDTWNDAYWARETLYRECTGTGWDQGRLE